eukprot:m.112324 g.112324  ORF g.112324 m.112324 type:complete len:373 (+) comp28186_c0_seq1:213-1331(+)
MTRNDLRRPRSLRLQLAIGGCFIVLAILWISLQIKGTQTNKQYQFTNTDVARPIRIFRNKNGATSVLKTHRIILATVPRSGNGWIRGLLEASTRLTTGSVYREPDSVYDEYTEAFQTACGWLKMCDVARSPTSQDNNPMVVKTHFPFLQRNDQNSTSLSTVKDRVPYVIIGVRNPLDNFDAWQRYIQKKLPGNAPEKQSEYPHRTLREFVTAWATHHKYWFHVEVPVTVYRYEDLVESPINVLMRALKASGLWDLQNIRYVDLLKVSRINSLRSYQRKQVGTDIGAMDDIVNSYLKYEAADIKWVLDTYEEELDRYGYRQLYSWWLKARTAYDRKSLQNREYTSMTHVIEKEIPKCMREFYVNVSWSEPWQT